MDARAAVIWSAGYQCDIGAHVFPMEKFRLLRDRLVGTGRLDPDTILEPVAATRDLLLGCHEEEYLDDLDGLRWTDRTRVSELPLTADIVHAYHLAAGGTVLAGREAVARGVAVNLGGGFHHAFADHAEGFCYLNDLAVAARERLAAGMPRVAIVDLDVHQGNGTARIFRDEPLVFTLSLHQERNYPVPKQRSDLDVGLNDGVEDDEYLSRLDQALASIWRFEPAIVFYQAGVDPFQGDLLGGLALSFEGLAERDARVLEGCAERGIPVAATLGGGYARRLEDTVRLHEQTCHAADAAIRQRIRP